MCLLYNANITEEPVASKQRFPVVKAKQAPITKPQQQGRSDTVSSISPKDDMEYHEDEDEDDDDDDFIVIHPRKDA